VSASRDCRGCWWQEGGRCYLEPVIREANGRSTKPAEQLCGGFRAKREVLRANLLPAVAAALVEHRRDRLAEIFGQPDIDEVGF